MQEDVAKKIEKLTQEHYLEKLDQSISPIVVTVKRDKSVKLALDSKLLNKAVHKNKYRMPNFGAQLQKDLPGLKHKI